MQFTALQSTGMHTAIPSSGAGAVGIGLAARPALPSCRGPHDLPDAPLRGLSLLSMVVSVAWWLSFLDRVGEATGVSVEALFREEWLCLIYTTNDVRLPTALQS
jgi:hypothetical protein